MAAHLERLIREWNATRFAPGRFNVLPGDASTIKDGPAFVHQRSWRSWISSDMFGSSEGSAFHMGLMPMPYLGNLRTARVFLCSLNPGLGPPDYFGEHRVSEYCNALQKNLRQDRDIVFPFLDPRHAWHGGSAYWAPRLRGMTECVRRHLKIAPREARELCAKSIAVLELVPYHSERFKFDRRRLDALRSTDLIRDFVFDELLPRHRNSDCKLIVLRSRNLWLRARERVADFPDAVLPRNAYITDQDAKEAAKLICRFA